MKAPTEFITRVQRLLDGFGHADKPLDPISRGILLHVATKTNAGERLRLSDIRFNSDFGSPVTALGRLQRLIQDGWITASPDPADGRAQLLSLTPEATRRLAALSSKLRSLASQADH